MTMKKVICFLSFMVMTMIMTTSCTKPDNGPVIPTSITTLADLNGTWEFQSFYLDATVPVYITDCASASLKFSFTFKGDSCTMSECGVVNPKKWKVEFPSPTNPTQINLTQNGHYYRFYIMNYSPETGILVLYDDGITNSRLVVRLKI
jgi:hypothetical protein